MSKTVTIQGVEFDLTTPYEEGHTLTAIEAAQLNTVRCENIANNMRSRVKAALEKNTPEEMTKVNDEVKQYDANYKFAAPGVKRQTSTMSPVEKAAVEIARKLVLNQLKAKGHKSLKEYKAADPSNAEKYEAAVAKVATMDDVVKQAKARVKQEAAEAQISLEGLAA